MIAKFFRSRSEQTTNVILVKYPNSGFADNALKGLGEYLALLPFVVLVVMFILLPLGLIIFNAFIMSMVSLVLGISQRYLIANFIYRLWCFP